jgi:hypothetical protein
VTSTVSPPSASRTYSLSLFFKIFKPTAFIRINVASGSYRCQGRMFKLARCVGTCLFSILRIPVDSMSNYK